MLEPAERQQVDLSAITGSVALTQFLVLKDRDQFSAYRDALLRAVLEAGGRRSHCVHIDQFLAGGEMPYEAITVDQFPNSAAVQQAFDRVITEREAAIADIYALIVRPRTGLPDLIKRMNDFPERSHAADAALRRKNKL